MKIFCIVLCLLLSSTSLRSQQPTGRPKIGVALQGGGAKGLAHIGVLQWLEEHHIAVDEVAGTSMGGLIGGLYATGQSPAELRGMVEQLDWGYLLAGPTPYRDLAFRRKEDLRAYPNRLELGLRNGLELPGGLSSGQPVRMLIDRYVLPYSDTQSFDDLPIPFRCVGTDLISGKSIVFQNGSLANALRATMSLPGIFSPVKEEGQILADGGLLNNLPTDVVKGMGADIVIGVHLTTGPVVPQNVSSFFQVAMGSSDVMINANELRGMERADILLTVDLAGYTTMDFSKTHDIIIKGYEAAQSHANVLSRFALKDDEWNEYVKRRQARLKTVVPVPQFFAVEGTSDILAKEIQEELAPFVGQPLNSADLENILTQQIGRGRFNSMSYGLTQRDGKPGLLISVEEKDYAPPWVKPGVAVDGADPDNVQFSFGSRLTFSDVGSYRSEVRLDFTIGSKYSLTTEYFHPLNPTTNWFVAPYIDVSRSSLNLYIGDTFVSEYKVNQFDGGADLGYSLDRFSELRFGYEAGYEKATRWIGNPLFGSLEGRTGRTQVRYAVDRLNDPVIPRKGIALLVNGGWTDANPGAHTGFPSGELTFEGFRPITRPASLYFIAAGGTTFGHDQTGLPPFALGGPTRLAAYGINQFLTNQYFYFRAGYLRRLGTLPGPIGNSFYLDAHYELAKPYDALSTIRLPNDGVVGIVMQTFLGPVLVGGSVGEGGHSKWFFQLGRVY
ncbi:MAG TPA: patatin-like phospholipase family protein [Bryobacteraceae bacterium]|jgi:NTE family protein|nr:patatin-like phospholipase family protein [Bryobacteraceae bacterium]